MGQSESPDKFHPPLLEFEEELDEQELFERAMQDVNPLPEQTKVVARPVRRRRQAPQVDPSEMMEQAAAEVTEASWPAAPGYQEGGELRWNRRLLRRLRRGRFAVQDELDLHGHSRLEAREALHRFVKDCVRRGVTCVRIVHGRGHHSPNQVPVLKQYVPQWLGYKQNARHVAAFASAPGQDGGAGALLVLLRKKPNGS